jgi:hypothetical protein
MRVVGDVADLGLCVCRFKKMKRLGWPFTGSTGLGRWDEPHSKAAIKCK